MPENRLKLDDLKTQKPRLMVCEYNFAHGGDKKFRRKNRPAKCSFNDTDKIAG